MAHATAELLTIGDEILYGQITDTNSQWMSQELDKIGIRVIRKTTVGDLKDDILGAFAEAEKRADIVLITGGLGPTNDDLTKPLLAEYFNCQLAMNDIAFAQVKSFFDQKGLELSDINRKQAELPTCCEAVSNTIGTAPGMWFERNAKVFVSMPGVPREMKLMMTDTVIPKLQHLFKTDVIYHKVIKTIGIGESWLSEQIKVWEDQLPAHISLAYLPSLGQVKLRLTAKGEDLHLLEEEVEEQIERLKPYAGQYIFGYNKDTIESAVGQLLLNNNLTIAIAESCTGGYLSHQLTSVAGSSQYYQGSMVPYHNDHKEALLHVDQALLSNHGAVSEAVVKVMAENIQKIFNADIGVATSGIAGPTGGTDEKPVGTIWIAMAYKGNVKARKLQLWRDRELNIKSTAIAVLNMIRITLSKSIELNK